MKPVTTQTIMEKIQGRVIDNYYSLATVKRVNFGTWYLDQSEDLYKSITENKKIFKELDDNTKRTFLRLYIFGNVVESEDANNPGDYNNPYKCKLLFKTINKSLRNFLRGLHAAIKDEEYKISEERQKRIMMQNAYQRRAYNSRNKRWASWDDPWSWDYEQ